MRDAWHEDRRRLIPAIAAIAVAAAPVIIISVQYPRAALGPIYVAWWTCVIAFVAAFLLAARWSRNKPRLVAMLLCQTFLGLLANWLIPMAIEGVALTGILLVVVA